MTLFGRLRFGRLRGALALAVALSSTGLLASPALAAGEKIAVYGDELTPGQRQEIEQLFGPDAANAKTVTVSHDDLVNSLSGAGIPVDPAFQATSSSLLTCLNKGDGLTVSTKNITYVPAAAYANALVTAGVGDGNVLFAGPPSHPLTGETALVGAMKAFPQCQAGKQPDSKRVNLAYQQLANTSDLAGDNGDLTAASNVMLKASQPVITGQAKDDAAIGSALDKAADDEGISVPGDKRPKLVSFLKQLSGLDYGTYAKGFAVEQLSPTQARVVPAGAGAPNSNSPNQFTGDVRQVADPLVVRSNGQDRTVGVAPGMVVTRNGQAAGLNDIQTGDRVRVTQAPDGATQRIDATSQSGTDWGRWLPLLLLIPLLLLALWALGRGRRDPFILERVPARATTVAESGRVVRSHS